MENKNWFIKFMDCIDDFVREYGDTILKISFFFFSAGILGLLMIGILQAILQTASK